MKRQARMKMLLAALGISFGLAAVALSPLYVRAEEGSAADVTELSQLMTANEAVDLKTEPQENAETIHSYQKDDPVFVTGKTADGWYRAVYQGKEGYIPEKALLVQELDVEGLDAELDKTKQEAELVVETVEKYHEETRRSRIWGIVIGILVVGIFAIGIISGIRSKGKPKK